MPPLRASLRAIALALLTTPAAATEIVACVVAPLPNNPAYYGTATTITQLKCEFTNKDYYPTLSQLYQLGWRLIQVVGGELALAPGNQVASPLYLLERTQAPAASPPAPTPPPKKPEPKESKK